MTEAEAGGSPVPPVMTGVCRYCQRTFEYPRRIKVAHMRFGEVERVVTRQVCDDCQAGRGRFRWKRGKRRLKRARARKRRQHLVAKQTTERAAAVTTIKPGVELTLEEVARYLGWRKEVVTDLEASALAKLRSEPKLREAWDTFKEAGLPGVEYMRQILRHLLSVPKEEQRLLFWQEVAEWNRLLDTALAQGVRREEVERARAAVDRCRLVLMRME